MDFTQEEVRVLGVLVEKELTTPDYYPLTLNALTTGCNQKSNREPVVDYSQSTAMRALDSLIRRRVAGHSAGAGSRAEKFRHALAEAWDLDVPHRSVLAVLLLRGPQTVGELRARTARMHSFESLEEVEGVLADLAGREEPLAVELPVLPGHKEARHMHLLEGEPDMEAIEAAAPTPRVAAAGLSEEVAELRERLEALEQAFEAFKTQFE